MSFLSRLLLAPKALRELGLQQVSLFVIYKFGLATGHYRRTDDGRRTTNYGQWAAAYCPLFAFPTREQTFQVIGQDGTQTLLAEADEIAAGKVRLFGSEPVELRLSFTGTLAHWTEYETGKAPLPNPQPAPRITHYASHIPHPASSDIKFLWEPARFGWAFTLGRAYHISGDEKYAEAFWRYTGQFLDGNPPYLGPNWMSGQEVAIRLMALVWAAQVFTGSPASTPERMRQLAHSVAQHASRIPPTLVYARSQNNNHLLTEAAGLLTAGLALPEHTQAAKWRKLGCKWLDYGFQHQINGYGEYSQHSTNYHRLMLQVALWVRTLDTTPTERGQAGTKEHKGNFSESLSPLCSKRLAAATHWLFSLLDPESGRVPNLGANDGAYIFPFTVCPFEDYRPVIQAAGRAFINYELPPGAWDEMCLWFGIPLASEKYVKPERYLGDHLYAKASWGCLRTAQFASRPSHADQLHLDLWWRGLNIAQDAGTYLYNAPAPWDNALTTALVHNTVTVDGRDQFTRAGRFLYLDWFDAYRINIIETDPAILYSLSGRYRKSGLRQTRKVTVFANERWQIEDELLTLRRMRKLPTFRLHWLLPNWEWKVEDRDSGMEIRLKSPEGWVILRLSTSPRHSVKVSLARAGELIYGKGPVSPIMGWVSPTYGVKIPALSFAVEVNSVETMKFISEFTFPTDH